MVAPENTSELYEETDFLILTVPLTDSTHHVIDETVFSALPERTILVNVSRSLVVNQEALAAALADGEIAGAGLDVFETEPLPESSPLWEVEKVIITSHIGGRTFDFPTRFEKLFAENYRLWTADDLLENQNV